MNRRIFFKALAFCPAALVAPPARPSSPEMPDRCVLKIQDSHGETTAMMDDEGNLWLKGEIYHFGVT